MPLQLSAAQLAEEAAKLEQAEPEQKKGIGWAPYAALAGGNAADAFTTHQALSSGRGQEGNPLLGQSPGKIVGMKAAMTIPQMLLMRYLAKAGHPKIAKGLGYGVGALGAGVAVHNSRVGK